MSERLAELQRQRALVQEHLAWLEREIAAIGKFPEHPAVPPAPASPAASAVPIAPAAAPVKPPAEAQVDELFAQYRTAPATVRQDVRKGCLLYFGLALGVLAASVAILYLALGPE